MLRLEYFRSFVNLEDFIPEDCSLKKKTHHITYLQPKRLPPPPQRG